MSVIFSEAEFDQVLERFPDRLTVLEASLTWCRPCKGFEPSYKVPPRLSMECKRKGVRSYTEFNLV